MKIEVLDLDDRVAVMSDGSTLPLTDFFDDDGDDCEPWDAVVCVAGSDSFGWLTISLLEVDEPVFH